MNPKKFPKDLKAAFTLVELLVSIAILSIILVALGSAIGFVSNLWLNGIGTVDNFTKARVMLNLLDRDIQMMVMRRDMAAFVNSSGNPACAFYTNVQGYNSTIDTRAVSLVQYQLPTPTATSSMLQRLNYGMNFSTTSGIVGNPAPTQLTQLSSVTTTGTETLATGVIFFQWQFVDGTGTIQNPTSSAKAFVYNYLSPSASSNYRAVIISMLVLNNSAYNLAIQTGNLANLSNGTTFPTTTIPSNQTYSLFWNNYLASPNSAFLALPPRIRSGFQVFQRYIPLPVTTTSS